MLKHVDIANYRGFKSYQVKDLAQVNLFVGKNNSGKTALLEGIQFLTSGGDVSVFADAAQRRGEVIVSRPDPEVTVDIAHFFHGHALSLDESMSFRGDNGYAPVAVKVYPLKSEGPDAPKRPVQGYFLRVSGPQKAERDEPRFAISRDGGVDFDVGPRYRRMGLSRRERSSRPVRFIGPDSLSSTDLAAMWDDVTLGGQEASIADALRVLDENLESLHFLTGMFSSGYFPSRGGIVVGIKGQESRIPIGSMGDGMRRLMAIATSLAFTKGGCLFVDEIDTGLHYSVMSDMWKLIVSKAVSVGSQVFATTHSWDCIEGLSMLCERHPELMPTVAIHKIDREIPHSISFSGESIVRMTKANIDPR